MHCADFSALYPVFKDITKLTLTPFCLFLCVRVQAEEMPGGQAPAELSETARRELMELCEDQFAHLEKVKSCLNLASHAVLPNQSLHVWRRYKLCVCLSVTASE